MIGNCQESIIKQTMVSTLEDLSVELFYEIFSYFQLHEICNMFWNVNSRLTAIIENLPSISVYLGRCGMNIEVTNFYYEYLSQPTICIRLTSLCVSDTVSIGNGLWFAKHGSTFINLRHLSLLDVERSSFGMIVGSLSPIDSLIMFSVRFVSADQHAAFTFMFALEGEYYARIFRLFPSLHVCHLLFGRSDHHTKRNPFWTGPLLYAKPIQSNLTKLRSLTLRYCSPEFLPRLFQHLPQLEQLSCHLYKNASCVLQQPPEHHYNKYVVCFCVFYLNG